MLDRKHPTISEQIDQISNPDARELLAKLFRDVLSEVVEKDDFTQVQLLKRVAADFKKAVSEVDIENVNGDSYESSELSKVINNTEVSLQFLRGSDMAVEILRQANKHFTFTVLDLKEKMSNPLRMLSGIDGLFEQGLIENKKMVDRRKRSSLGPSRRVIEVYRITQRGQVVLKAFEKSS